MLNADAKPLTFRMPTHVGIARWGVEIDTCYANGERTDRRTFNAGESYPLQGRSTALLRLIKSPC